MTLTLTLTLNRIILHTVMHHKSTSTYVPNFIEIKETICGWTDVRTFETGFIRSTWRSQPKKGQDTPSTYGRVTHVDWLVGRLASPFSTKIGHIGHKVLGGDLVLPG